MLLLLVQNPDFNNTRASACVRRDRAVDFFVILSAAKDLAAAVCAAAMGFSGNSKQITRQECRSRSFDSGSLRSR